MTDNTQRNQNSSAKPDPGTLHTTDPEKNMEGPMSSPTRKTGELFETNETQKEADKKRDEHMKE